VTVCNTSSENLTEMSICLKCLWSEIINFYN